MSSNARCDILVVYFENSFNSTRGTTTVARDIAATVTIVQDTMRPSIIKTAAIMSIMQHCKGPHQAVADSCSHCMAELATIVDMQLASYITE